MFMQKNNVYCRRRSDLELPDIECVWLELNSHHRKFLIGTFYRPPNSSAEILSLIEDSIGLAFDTNVNNIVIWQSLSFYFSPPTAGKCSCILYVCFILTGHVRWVLN